MKSFLLVTVVALLSGCVNLHIKEPIPEGAVVEVYISVYKSNSGNYNTIDQQTDAELPLVPMGNHSAVVVED